MRRFPATAPEQGRALRRHFRRPRSRIVPGLTGWQHPGWFAYFPGNFSPDSVLAEMVAAGLGQQGMMWSTSPIATELEMRVLDWLVDCSDFQRAGRWQDRGEESSRSAPRTRPTSPGRGSSHQVGRAGVRQSGRLHERRSLIRSIEKGARVAGYRHYREVLGVDCVLRDGSRMSSRPRSPRTWTEGSGAGLCLLDGGHHRNHRRRSGPSDRMPLPGRHADVAPRRCCLRRKRHDLSRVPSLPARTRTSRQLRLQPAQVARHELRLLGPLCRRSASVARHALDHSPLSSAPPRLSPTRSWTFATGRLPWADVSGRSSCGG